MVNFPSCFSQTTHDPFWQTAASCSLDAEQKSGLLLYIVLCVHLRRKLSSTKIISLSDFSKRITLVLCLVVLFSFLRLKKWIEQIGHCDIYLNDKVHNYISDPWRCGWYQLVGVVPIINYVFN